MFNTLIMSDADAGYIAEGSLVVSIIGAIIAVIYAILLFLLPIFVWRITWRLAKINELLLRMYEIQKTQRELTSHQLEVMQDEEYCMMSSSEVKPLK